METFLLIIFFIDVVLLIIVILLQAGSGAEAGMFGSDITMGAFGAKTSEVLLRMTRWLVAIFLVSSFLIGFLRVQETKKIVGQQRQEQQQDQGQTPPEVTPTNEMNPSETPTATGTESGGLTIPTTPTTSN